MKTDRELLELAARAAGIEINVVAQQNRDALGYGHVGLWTTSGSTCWNPLDQGETALRLAAQLSIGLMYYREGVRAVVDSLGRALGVTFAEVPDRDVATRRAIVRAAAAIAEARA
jgi:hypothetical protein